MQSVIIPTMTSTLAEGSGQSKKDERQISTVSFDDINDEKRLAIAAKGGCLKSFEQLVSIFETRLYHFLLKKTRDHHLSQDLLQATFVIAYRKLHLFNPKYAISTWIYTIANRQAINHFRRQRPIASEEVDIVVKESPEVELLANEKSDEIWSHAKRILSQHQFDALWFFYGEDRNLEGTASVMNRSVGSVKVLLHRARKKLENELPANIRLK
ncbi:MAG: sigma-70 family RNA polymerase sigma factor [Verrucomicrobiota bacterium]|nr:sigma-70 family RNA polymerase sigma factor [Verrucomicrobiota bacterium]